MFWALYSICLYLSFLFVLCYLYLSDHLFLLSHFIFVYFLFLFIYFYFCIFFYLAAPGLSCSTRDLVPQPEIEPRLPALTVWSFSHWTTREVPQPL